jgi:hypothetical protein
MRRNNRTLDSEPALASGGAPMALSPDTIKEIDAQVRGGFEDRARIIEIFCEERYAPGELVAEEVEAAVDEAIAKHAEAKRSWPEVTDCDRLDKAFDAIKERGIIALQNTGYTQSDGYDDFREVYRASPDKAAIIGYCFYHGQDLERAVAGDGLVLAFGPVDGRQEQAKGPAIGRLIVEELKHAGFEVVWDGTFDHRIQIPRFEWKKR